MDELSTLLVDFNKLTDISPIKALPQLRGVYANNNLLANDSAVDDMVQLSELYLYENNFSAVRKAEIQVALPDVRLQF